MHGRDEALRSWDQVVLEWLQTFGERKLVALPTLLFRESRSFRKQQKLEQRDIK